MRRFVPLGLLALLLLAGTQSLHAQAAVAGTWELSWETQRGPSTTTIVFEQDGTALKGNAQMAMRGGPPGGGGGGAGRPGGGMGGAPREVPVTGTVDGNKITFSITMGMGERTMTQTFTATVTGNTMEGTMSRGQGDPIPFKGTKKEG